MSRLDVRAWTCPGQVLSSTRTSGGSLRPPKRPSKARNGQKSPFLVWTQQFWSQDPIKPFPDGAFIGELITLKDTPSISNRLASRGQTPAKKNTSWPISPLYSIYIQKKVLDQNKKAQTHLKSFNGRQGGILQSISGVSGASGGLKSQNFDFLTQKFKMAQNGSNSSQNGSNSSQTQNGSNSSQTHLKNSKWLKMAQTHLKIFTF